MVGWEVEEAKAGRPIGLFGYICAFLCLVITNVEANEEDLSGRWMEQLRQGNGGT